MNNMIQLVKADYLQRTRSYAFLVTLGVTVYGAYAFIPSVDASYITLRIGNYVGEYNSAWIGSATAMLTSTFLFLFGYFLVNSGISRDITTGVGQIIAATSVSNFKYLWTKALSNFLVLFTIVVVVLLVSIGLSIFRSGFNALVLSDFLLPYLFILVPSVSIVSICAVLGEVLLGRYKAIQYLLYFFFFTMLLSQMRKMDNSHIGQMLDPTGSTLITGQIQQYVRDHLDSEKNEVSSGFIFGHNENIKRFEFPGLQWNTPFIISRVTIVLSGIGLLFVVSLVFHRFDIRERIRNKKQSNQVITHLESHSEWKHAKLPPLNVSFAIIPLIRMEFLMIIRTGSKWFWIPNIGLMIALIFAPLAVAHQILLPVLWFLQVGRIADIATKEMTNGVHHFSFGSFRPLTRLFPAQAISTVFLLFLLSVPLLLRYAFIGEWLSMIAIITGNLFIVLVSLFIGQLSGGRKLFDILFFMLTFANLNKAPVVDYFGGLGTSVWIITVLMLVSIGMYTLSVLLRKRQMMRL